MRETKDLIQIMGVSAPIRDWARVSGRPASTISWRLHHGYAPSAAVFQPSHALYSIYDNRTDLPLVTGRTAQDCAAYLGIKYQSFKEELCGRERSSRTIVREDWEFDPEEYRDAICKAGRNVSYDQI